MNIITRAACLGLLCGSASLLTLPAAYAAPEETEIQRIERLYEEEKFEQILPRIQALAAQGNADAQFRLGRMYYYGQILPQDYKMAAMWYQRAAAQGQLKAMNNLGNLYRTGEGVTQDYTEALRWLNLPVIITLPHNTTLVPCMMIVRG